MVINLFLIKCENYDAPLVEQAVASTGLISQLVKPGQKVLIKPNALLGSLPEAAVTTHPSLVAAVVKEVIKAGGIALVGDSPGNAFGDIPSVMRKTGIEQATLAAGGQMVYFQQGGVTEITNKRNQIVLRIAQPVLAADLIINLPKLKTHNLTAYTGAIKNMFGVVPGFYKARFHSQAPHPDDFAELIVDIFEVVRPQLTIMDAIIGMEGPGPSAGHPRKLGAIIASTDSVAIDAVASHLIGYRPEEILTTMAAYRRGLGEYDLNKITILGPTLESLRQSNWKKSFSLYQRFYWVPKTFFKLLPPILDRLRVDPEIDQAKCTRCLICVKNCPVKTINYDQEKKRVSINLKECINCFCCHELCEYHAIKLNLSWLARLLGLG